jgi:hypothetical protein
MNSKFNMRLKFYRCHMFRIVQFLNYVPLVHFLQMPHLPNNPVSQWFPWFSSCRRHTFRIIQFLNSVSPVHFLHNPHVPNLEFLNFSPLKIGSLRKHQKAEFTRRLSTWTPAEGGSSGEIGKISLREWSTDCEGRKMSSCRKFFQSY